MKPDLIEDIYELSPLQRGMLFQSLCAPDAGLYLEQLCFDITGPLDIAKFQAAWDRVIHRHGVLRTALQWQDLEKPYQIVFREVTPEWHLEDWSSLNDTEWGDRLASLLARDRARGFQLDEPPLFRFHLLRRGAATHRFIWTVGHILLDGWSWPLLIRELFAFYDSLRNGRAWSPAAPRPFRDYILWMQQQDLGKAEAFWREYLGGYAGAAPLSLHFAAPQEQKFRFDRKRLALNPEATRALNTLALRTQVTLNTIVQAAWGLLLSRYTGSEDIVFGSVVAGRPPDLPGVEAMVGLFINTLPVRIRVPRDVNLTDWLRDLQARHAAAREFDFSSLTDVQGWSEIPRGSSLFDSVLAFENYPLSSQSVRLSETVEIGNVEALDFTNYPLSVSVVPGTQLLAEIIYDVDRFDPASIDRMLGHFETLLEGMASHPHASPSALPMLTAAERGLILAEWNATETAYPRGKCVHELFSETAAVCADRIAITFGEQEITYRDLDHRSNQVARYLLGRGVMPQELVGIMMERSIDAIVAMIGILKAGAAYLPFDPAYPPERLRFMFEDSAVRYVLTQDRLTASRPDMDTVEYVCVDTPGNALAAASTDPVHSPVAPEHLAYVMYTSGSTGRPKGVCIPHRGIVRLVRNTNYMDLGSSEVFLQFAPISFDAATLEIWGPLLNGGRLVVFAGQSASMQELAGTLARGQVTSLFLTTALFNLMVDNRVEALRGIRQLLFGGELVSVPHVQKALGALPETNIIHVYGPTENTTFTTWFPIPRGCTEWTTIPIGRPISNSRVYVLDDQLRPVPVGVPGELYTAGDGLATGYWHRPELTNERFIRNPNNPGEQLYRTGDIARWLPGGDIEFAGRIDSQVKIRGFRIEPGEIESVLAEHPAVQTAVVVAREDRPGDRRLVAYTTARRGTAASQSELRMYLQDRLPSYMVPSCYVALDTLPLSANGKIDRAALPPPEILESDSANRAAPATELERTVASMWQEALAIDKVGRDDNFFDLGGHSLSLIQVHAKVQQLINPNVTIVDLFKYPTVRSLAEFLGHGGEAESARAIPTTDGQAAGSSKREREPIAIVAMAGRFPGARNVDELWANLKNGIESVQTLTDQELRNAGVDHALLEDPGYVKAAAILPDAELFDAHFFGITPRQAEITDPQHRLFLECAHEALELAGCDPQTWPGRIGVYAGAAMSTYLYFNLQPSVSGAGAEPLQLLIGNDKDFVPSRVAYKLNLRGPAVNVQTACSTSLVAVHMGCEGLRNGDCDMVLAGGVTVRFPQARGYLYQEQGIASPDGHCRAFDADARGTIGGNGVAIVVLKRLSDAVAQGDQIHAVILGSAINNDGSGKVGYTAPGIEGQAAVIAEAQRRAGVSPESIGCIEAHGTGTQLGDPIEIAALKQAFGNSDGVRRCAIGSLKTNLGHLDAAAGVAGLIKAALQLKHRELVPSLHFRKANPKLGLEDSPFYVNTQNRSWDSDGQPRRAAVSSFGIGGTNAHVVLEEPPVQMGGGALRDWTILPISAKTETALRASCDNLADWLISNPDADLADVAFTLQAGRTRFERTSAIVCATREEAVNALRGGDGQRVYAGSTGRSVHPVAFLFPGQGSQYVGMTRELYANEAVFRDELDRCAGMLQPHLGVDIRDILYPRPGDEDWAERSLGQTIYTQPALFAVEYALAQMWIGWGVRPGAMIGHSVGEYVAACIAGVMTLEDALRVIAARARLMQDLPSGAMLAVDIPEQEAERMAANRLCVAAVNAPRLCVLSGSMDAVEVVERELGQRGSTSRRLRTSHAFHSKLMEPILERFADEMRQVNLQPPSIPFVSNVTGTWIRAEEATDPLYWATHLRRKVRFADGVSALLGDELSILLEVGPGQTLSNLTRRISDRGRTLVATLGQPNDERCDMECVTSALARLWAAGAPMDWVAYHRDERRLRVALPTYPFERERYWVEPRGSATSAAPVPALTKKADPADWFHVPSWKRSVPAELQYGPAALTGPWLLFGEEDGIGGLLRRQLRDTGHQVSLVSAGRSFARVGEGNSTIDATHAEDYDRILSQRPRTIVHVWTASETDPERLMTLGFHSLMHIAQSLGRQTSSAPVRLIIVTRGLQDVLGGEPVSPVKAALCGPCAVIPQEYSFIRTQLIDAGDAGESGIAGLVSELLADSSDAVVAYRRGHRWVQTLEPVRIGPKGTGRQRLRERGVYLITGGTGGIGLALAEYLARTVRARLVLVNRSPFPPREAWDGWIASHGMEDRISRRIGKIRECEAHGAEILMLPADVSDPASMEEAVARARERFGNIEGIVHSAGVAGGGLIQLRSRQASELVWAPKARGTEMLLRACANPDLQFIVLCSSLSAAVGGIGQADYCAANCFLNAFALARTGLERPFVTSIAWDTWGETGMAVEAIEMPGMTEVRRQRLQEALLSGEGTDVFCRVISSNLPLVFVSTTDLAGRMEDNQPRSAAAEPPPEIPAAAPRHARPALQSSYARPETDTERTLAAVWQKHLGIEQVGVLDNFFELGGDSLLLVQIQSELRRALSMDMPATDLLRFPTIRSLANALHRGAETPSHESVIEERAASRQQMLKRRREVRSGR